MTEPLNLEPVTLAEAIARADDMLRSWDEEPPLLSTWVTRENARRAAAKQAYQNAEVEIAGTKLVVGQWYDVTVKPVWATRKPPTTWRICQYLGRRRGTGRYSVSGPADLYRFDRWGGTAEKDPHAYGREDGARGDQIVGLSAITPGPNVLERAVKRAADRARFAEQENI